MLVPLSGFLKRVEWGIDSSISYSFAMLTDQLEVIVLDASSYLTNGEEPEYGKTVDADSSFSLLPQGEYNIRDVEIAYYYNSAADSRYICIIVSTMDIQAFSIIFVDVESQTVAYSYTLDAQRTDCYLCYTSSDI